MHSLDYSGVFNINKGINIINAELIHKGRMY